MKDVRLALAPFSAGAEIDAFTLAHGISGGIVSFTGQVRAGDGCEALELSHYEPLTLPGMEALADQALSRFALDGVVVIHRSGLMTPGETIVLAAAAARHRRDAFLAADFLMDHLKSQAWFWKREKRADGWHWIDPRGADHADLARWK